MSTATAHWRGNVRDFLGDARRFGVLAARDEEGRPWQTVVWYDVRDDGILVNSLAGRRWPALLRHDPSVSFTVADGYDYVIVRGHADLLAEGEQAAADIGALARRYGADPTAFEGQTRVSFLIRPEQVATHGTVQA